MRSAASHARCARAGWSAPHDPPAAPETVTLHVPFRVLKRGGRKEMHLPEGATQTRRTDNRLVKLDLNSLRWIFGGRLLISLAFLPFCVAPR